MSVIVTLSIVAGVACAAFAAMPPSPSSRALRRVRVARGRAPHGVLDAARSLPLVRAWRPADERALRLAGLTRVAVADLALAKVGCGVAGIVFALAVGLPPVVALGLGFASFVLPSEIVARRARAAERSREEAVLPLVERLLALATAGFTIEQSLGRVAEAASPLGPLLAESERRASLGVPAFDALADVSARENVSVLADLARDLARARRGGRPLLPVLAERRETLRLARRALRLEAASRVDGALSLVLVGAYLPALLLLVVIPLFLGLLAALGT